MAKFNVGDTIKGRSSGRIYKVLAIQEFHYQLKHNLDNCVFTIKDVDYACVLITPAKPQGRQVCVKYYNVYPSSTSESHSSRAEADEQAEEGRLSCVRVVFNEGVFDV